MFWVGPHEVLFRVMPPQERRGTVGVGPEVGHGDAQRTGASLQWRKIERARLVQPEEKAPKRYHQDLPVIKVIK